MMCYMVVFQLEQSLRYLLDDVLHGGLPVGTIMEVSIYSMMCYMVVFQLEPSRR